MKKRTGGNRYFRYWTRERIIEAIQEWAREFGEPPRMSDWDADKARRYAEHHERIARDWRRRARYIDSRSDIPSTSVVKKEFGSWSKGLEAAGFGLRRAVRMRRKVDTPTPPG